MGLGLFWGIDELAKYRRLAVMAIFVLRQRIVSFVVAISCTKKTTEGNYDILLLPRRIGNRYLLWLRWFVAY